MIGYLVMAGLGVLVGGMFGYVFGLMAKDKKKCPYCGEDI